MTYYEESCSYCSFPILLEEGYMVHNEVWLSSGYPEFGAMLHISCLEYNLGRPLTPQDFTSCLLNYTGGFWKPQSAPEKDLWHAIYLEAQLEGAIQKGIVEAWWKERRHAFFLVRPFQRGVI